MNGIHDRRAGARGGLSLFSALLDVSAHELLGVLLENRVDLVEQVIHVLGQLFVALGDLGVGFWGRSLVDFLITAGLAGLRLATGVTGRHGSPSSFAKQCGPSAARTIDVTRIRPRIPSGPPAD